MPHRSELIGVSLFMKSNLVSLIVEIFSYARQIYDGAVRAQHN